ncbi:Ubiquinone biosynthesis O-methyltransferase [uncultured archaeon]|nr:Ubiquinone biosynthesis O-methyltransferase [uncultured archaeon]
MKTEKFGLITDYCKGKDVLDIGCIGDKVESEGGQIGLFSAIERVAKSVVGVDNNQKRIESIRPLGKNIVFGDAERLGDLKFRKEFEVIVASELIEHLNNPGMFLKGVNDSLQEDGRAVITTPNAFFSIYYMYMLLRMKPQIWPEHTCLFDEITATELFRRHGFEVERFEYMNDFSNISAPIKFLFSLWNRRFGTYLFFVLRKSGTVKR